MRKHNYDAKPESTWKSHFKKTDQKINPQAQTRPTIQAEHDSEQEGLAPTQSEPSLLEQWGGASPEVAAQYEDPSGGASVQALGSQAAGVMPKLTIGAPNDRYEQEADRIAAQVVNRINSPTPDETSEARSDADQAGGVQNVQMKAIQPSLQLAGNGGGIGVSPEFESDLQGARAGGQSLDSGLQRSMGQAMGADFSGVRVHTDSQADQLNQKIQAKAFTTGEDIFFRAGTYDPASKGGQELIAHELTHVIQQGGAQQSIQRDDYANVPYQQLGDEELDEEDEEDNLTVTAGPFTYEDGKLSIEVLGGKTLSFGTKGGELSGDIPDESFSSNFPSLNLGVDIPVAPGVFVAASLAVKPKLEFTIGGGTYSVEVNGEEQSATLSVKDVAASGELGLAITARAGVGVGLANLAGAEAGLYGKLSGEASLKGSLSGSTVISSSPSYNMKLNLNADAAIKGEAGAYAKAKFLQDVFEITKEVPLVETTFASVGYHKAITIGGSRDTDWYPTMEDLTKVKTQLLTKDLTPKVKETKKRTKKVDKGPKYEELVDQEDTSWNPFL